MVHSVVLVDMRKKKSQHLTFDPKKIKDYNGPSDDIIVFAHSAKISGKVILQFYLFSQII